MMPRHTPHERDASHGASRQDAPTPASAQTARAHVLLPAAAAHLREPFLLRVLIALAARAADDGWCRLNMRQLAAFIGTDTTHSSRGAGLADTRDIWTALYQLAEMGLIEGRANTAYARELDPLAVTSWHQDVPARFWRILPGAGAPPMGEMGEGAPE